MNAPTTGSRRFRTSSGPIGGIRERGRTARQRVMAAYNQGVMPGDTKEDAAFREADRVASETPAGLSARRAAVDLKNEASSPQPYVKKREVKPPIGQRGQVNGPAYGKTYDEVSFHHEKNH